MNPERQLPQLLERANELAALDRLIEAASSGSGAAVMIEGEAGIGKTQLLEAARRRAEASGLLVLSARGGELERDFSYGVVRQLFERAVTITPTAPGEDLLAGPARPAAAVLGAVESEALPETDAAFLIQHALYWLTVNLSAARPLLLCVDDAHWADEVSVHWLVHLARRLDGLPVSLALSWRLGDPDAPAELRGALHGEPTVDVVEPGVLSASACASLVKAELGNEADPAFCAACCTTAGGNPFLLGELVRALGTEGVRPEASAVGRVTTLSSATASRSVLVRLAHLSPPAVALAGAAAVLDHDADIRLAGELADIDERAAVDAVAELARARILDPGDQLRFVHPIMRTAVYDELSRPRRAAMHRHAARRLEQDGLADRAAVHLLSAGPAGDPSVVTSLRAAARRALVRGAPGGAVSLLRRALREPPTGSERGRLLFELGDAERMAGDPDAVQHLREALELAPDPDGREVAARCLAQVLTFGGHVDEAVEIVERVIDSLPEGDRERRLRLEVELVTFGLSSEANGPRLAARLAELAEQATGATPAERALLATFGLGLAESQRVPAGSINPVLDRAWADGRLLDDGAAFNIPLTYCLVALTHVDRLQEAREIGDRAVAIASERGAIIGLAAAQTCRGRAAMLQGDVVGAEADLTNAVHLSSLSGLALGRYWALSQLVTVLVYRCEFAAAERLLAEHGVLDQDPPPGDFPSSVILIARAGLRLAQDRLDDARRDAEEYFARVRGRGGEPFANTSRLGLVLLRQGDSEGARRIADAALETARRFDVPGEVGVALSVRGMIEGGERGIEMLGEAARLMDLSPRRLDAAEVLVDLGASLRRANRRADAREPLRRALNIAQACGAPLLIDRAHTELRACGARPRRLVLSGVDSLTASERRVALMAAEGRTNREIAQTLYVTPKTVETHLRAAFRKLGVERRTELAQRLAAA